MVLKVLKNSNQTGGAKILNPAMPFKLSETQSTVSIPANFNIDNSSAGRNCKNNKDGLIPDIKITHSINNLIKDGFVLTGMRSFKRGPRNIYVKKLINK